MGATFGGFNLHSVTERHFFCLTFPSKDELFLSGPLE